MAEKDNGKTIYSLLEVTKSIQKILTERYTSSFWVKAEMNKVNFYRHSGHSYPELVEKKDGKIVAQVKATLWKDDYYRVNDNFQRVLKEPLKDGIKILFLARISFDPVHGLSLWILDIDPSYTLGDLEREKQETIERLQKEGIFENNKVLPFPVLPQRIAIISVETSKGYVDFLRVIDTNEWNYKFFHLLFPSLLQGDKVVQSISAQLERIKKVKHHFDVVAIVRGGGGDVGLSCYNDYQLAKQVALFPLPVITGIGHATNETVTEMVSHVNAITPTKLAQSLLQAFHNFSVPVQDAQTKLVDKCNQLLKQEGFRFHAELKLFSSVTENVIGSNQHKIRTVGNELFYHSRFVVKNHAERIRELRLTMIREARRSSAVSFETLMRFNNTIRKDAIFEIHQSSNIVGQLTEKLMLHTSIKFKSTTVELNSVEKNVANLDPVNVLRRGYSITQLNGKTVTTVAELKEGDVINTQLVDGAIRSTIQSAGKTQTSERNY